MLSSPVLRNCSQIYEEKTLNLVFNSSQLAKLEEYSSHATAMKFIGYKQLVLKIPIILEKYDFYEYVTNLRRFL